MSFEQLLPLLGALGFGGVVGGLLGLLTAGKRVADALALFEPAFKRYMSKVTDPDGLALRDQYAELSLSLEGLTVAFDRLRRALRKR